MVLLLCLFVFIFYNLVSVQFSHSVMSDSLRPHESQHTRPVHHQLPEFIQTHIHRVGDAIQPSHPLSSPSPPAPNSLPATGSFPMSQHFIWGGQSIGVSASASVLPMNTQGWSPLGWAGWISMQSKGLLRVFSNTIVQTHQFFCAQLSSQSSSHRSVLLMLHKNSLPLGPCQHLTKTRAGEKI